MRTGTSLDDGARRTNTQIWLNETLQAISRALHSSCDVAVLLLNREMNSHVDSVTPFPSMILFHQRSPNIINLELHVLKRIEQEQLALLDRLFLRFAFALVSTVRFTCG